MSFQRVLVLAVIVTACGCGRVSTPHGAGLAAGADAGLRPAPVAGEESTAEGPRARYRYAVVPAGVYSAAELAAAVEEDAVVARHYGNLRLTRVRAERTTEPVRAFVSYRVGGQVYWTSRRVSIPAGETILTDGTTRIRARCGNAISAVPMAPTQALEPDLAELDREVQPPAHGDPVAAPEAVSNGGNGELAPGEMPRSPRGMGIPGYAGAGATGLPRAGGGETPGAGGSERPAAGPDGGRNGSPGARVTPSPGDGGSEPPGGGGAEIPGDGIGFPGDGIEFPGGGIDFPGGRIGFPGGGIDFPGGGGTEFPVDGGPDLPHRGGTGDPGGSEPGLPGGFVFPGEEAIDFTGGGGTGPPGSGGSELPLRPVSTDPVSVPEPGLLLLLGSGAAALIARRRRRIRKSRQVTAST